MTPDIQEKKSYIAKWMNWGMDMPKDAESDEWFDLVSNAMYCWIKSFIYGWMQGLIYYQNKGWMYCPIIGCFLSKLYSWI